MKRHAKILGWLWMFTGLIMLLVMAVWAQTKPSVKSIELPEDNSTAKLKPGPGTDTTESNCMGCHSTDYIVRQPGADAEHWQAEVNKMIKLYGASISDEDAKVIVDYLAAAYGPTRADATTKGRAAGEQTSFREDEPLEHMVPLPVETMRALLETDEAEQGLAFATESQRNDPAQLFRAAEVHLDGAEEYDLVVIGIPPMAGADNGWFWVVRSARTDPKVVLFAGGNSLDLMDSRTNGSRDIRSFFSTPSESREAIYHFDGSTYKLWRVKRKLLDP